ncbi:MAG TPA: serine/threonine-protein kinase, partial [Planctomycetia bacterium]|nr:serine/threonine-protein kinase [Planctomycetia bacterium]
GKRRCRPAAATDSLALKRFNREIELTKSLKHPNIVEALEASEIGSVRFLVMEYIDGRDLSYWLKKLGRLPVSAACEVVAQVARGLDYAHRQGLVHRDVKPQNLIAVKDSSGHLQVKILDFGLARPNEESAAAQVTGAGQILGTVDYLAPEATHGTGRVDRRADFYSLGVVLYELLTGEVPFPRENFMARLVARVMEPSPDVRLGRPEAPGDLADAVSKLLATDPADRFASGAEIAAALEPFARPLRVAAGAVFDERAQPLASPLRETRIEDKITSVDAKVSEFEFALSTVARSIWRSKKAREKCRYVGLLAATGLLLSLAAFLALTPAPGTPVAGPNPPARPNASDLALDRDGR